MWVKPPHCALGYLALAWALHHWLPITRVFQFSQYPWGWAFMGMGVGVAASALLTFKSHGTTHEPHGLPTVLVMAGPFAYTRNPMYLSVTAILFGVAVNAGTLPYFLVPVAFALTIHRVFIPREERRLEHFFGQAYRDYQARTPRWM